MLPRVRRRTVTYGVSAQAELRIVENKTGPAGSEFRLREGEQDLGWFKLPVPGHHNVLNATAAIGIALELDVPADRIREGLATYGGVDRRMQVKGVERGVTVMDDYGHHPTEVRATLAAARLGPYRRVLVLFQPHRFTRTQLLMDEFARAFHVADRVFVTDIYAASEPPLAGVTGEALTGRLRDFGHRGAQFVGGLDAGIEAIAAEAGAGDLVITLGAGSVSQGGDKILRALAARATE
jgi:UDP-N-acetylmuramate--alanine ligase